MLTTTSLERNVEALERAQQHWQQYHAQRPAGGPATVLTVALEREAGAPGTSVAREVGARLHWQVYDHELLELIAREMGLRVHLLESVDERRQSWILESLEAFSSGPPVSEAGYVRHLVQTLLALAAHGECVIVGRGGAQVLPRDRALRVRLVAERADRVKALAARLNLSERAAERKVDEMERERIGFVKSHFGKDPVDPEQYDLILNTSRWSVGQCADLIIRAVQLLRLGQGSGGKEGT
jgi:cytidylate kinase